MNILLILAVLFCFIFLVLGFVFLGLGLYFRKKSGTAQSWPVTPGEILSVNVKEHSDMDEDSAGSSTYEPQVEYVYQVAGQTYTNRRISFGANRFGLTQAQSVAARYPVGTKIEVHYNPAKPQEAVLEVRAGGSTIFIVVGIILLAISVVSCCVSIAGVILSR